MDAIEKDVVEPELFGEDESKVQGDASRKADLPIGCVRNIRLAVLPSPPTQRQSLPIVHFPRFVRT